MRKKTVRVGARLVDEARPNVDGVYCLLVPESDDDDR